MEATSLKREAWNKGKLVGQKPPLKPKEIWAIRIHLQNSHAVRDLALFNLAIDSKLRGCDLVSLHVRDVTQSDSTSLQRQRAKAVAACQMSEHGPLRRPCACLGLPLRPPQEAMAAADCEGNGYLAGNYCYHFGIVLRFVMRIIAISTLRTFWESHPDAETPLRSWYALASRTTWKTPADIKAAYGNASFTGNNRVVFNIKGNDYRLVVAVRYDRGLMYVRFVGTHRQYDKIHVETI